jgi:hypothetical protein
MMCAANIVASMLRTPWIGGSGDAILEWARAEA